MAQGVVRVNPVGEESHLGEGTMLKNPGSKVTKVEVTLLRYLYKIPQSVQVWAPEAYERINWVMPG